jgi:hypothetical protein
MTNITVTKRNAFTRVPYRLRFKRWRMMRKMTPEQRRYHEDFNRRIDAAVLGGDLSLMLFPPKEEDDGAFKF